MAWGVDYSHYQNYPNVLEMAEDGVEFVIIKAWEGSSPDPHFATNISNAHAASMPAMAYVFLRPSDAPSSMRACFNHIGRTVLCLDWEASDVKASVVEAWMEEYELHYRRCGMVYYGLYPPDDPTPRIGKWPRWFPRYSSSPGLPPWDGIDKSPDWRDCYAIWQNSCTGRVNGVDGDVDTDQLAPALTIGDLMNWLNHGRVPHPHIDIVKPAIAKLQGALNVSGYDAGTVDGLWGPHTQSAIDRYNAD